MQRLHTFTLQELQRIIKIAERHLPLLIIIPIFAQCSPFVGLVERKYRALSHLRLIFFCSNLNFPRKYLAVSRKHAIFAVSYKIILK